MNVFIAKPKLGNLENTVMQEDVKMGNWAFLESVHAQ